MHLTDGDGHSANDFKELPLPATQVDKDWLNMVQRELWNVLVSGLGVTPIKNTNTQIRDGLGLDHANGQIFKAHLDRAGGTGERQRMYAKWSDGDISEFWIVLGASFDLGALEWTSDGGWVIALRLGINGVEVLTVSAATAAAPWTEGDWIPFNADVAQALVPQQAFIGMTLAGTHANSGGGFAPAQYSINMLGDVILDGDISGGGAAPTVITTLPAPYRPTTFRTFLVNGNGAAATIRVDPDGSVRHMTGSPTNLCLHGVRFRVAT